MKAVPYGQQPLVWTNVYMGLHEELDVNGCGDQYFFVGTIGHYLVNDLEYNHKRLDYCIRRGYDVTIASGTRNTTVLRCMVDSILSIHSAEHSYLVFGSLPFFQVLADAHAPLESSFSELEQEGDKDERSKQFTFTEQLMRIADNSKMGVSKTHHDMLKQIAELFDKPTPA